MAVDGDKKMIKKPVTIAMVLTMSTSTFAGLVILPFVMMHLSGTKKVFVMLQQISMLLQHILMIVEWSVWETNIDNAIIEVVKDFLDKKEDTIFNGRIMSHFLINFFAEFANSEFYFASMMHSYDFFIMICHPFDYAEFQGRKVWRLIFLGTLVCFVFSVEYLVCLIVNISCSDGLYYKKECIIWVQDARVIIAIYTAIKTIILKIVYFVTIKKLASKTKKALDESAQMKPDHNQRDLHNKLYTFTLIPIFLNFLYLFHEVPFLVVAIISCMMKVSAKISYILQCVKGGMFTLGLVTYVGAFVTLFPKIKESLCCLIQKRNNS